MILDHTKLERTFIFMKDLASTVTLSFLLRNKMK